MLELVTCDFTWERNNDYKGRARLAYPLSPEWNWKLVFIEFRIRLSELMKTKTKLLFCCEPVEHSVPLHQLSNSGLVLLLLELLQSLMDTLTEESEMKSWVSVSVLSKTEEGRRGRKLQKTLPGGTSPAWGLECWWVSLGDGTDHILR